MLGNLRLRCKPGMLLAALLCALAAKPAPAPAPVTALDWFDVLDFDQGTLLTNAPPSRGEGVEPWSAFFLADGSPAGWSSAEGKARGVEFLYELERDCELKLLRLSNENVEETAYPGISTRTVELWVARAAGDYEKIGTYEVPKGGLKEFPLPEHAPVRRIKLVIAGNWGHPSFTELMEVDVLGKEVGPIPKFDLAGEYHSSLWSGLRIRQSGQRVEGCYDYNDGTFFGELDGRVARVVWSELVVDGRPRSKGTATFIVNGDKSAMRGIYFVDGDLAVRGEWNLERPKTPDKRPKCDPPGLSLREQLKRTGRLRLYGIHFDVGSDVLRPDSEPTLTSIRDMLAEDGSLKLLIEGHTDSTNSKKYNQALSERRAAAVRQWLVDQSVKPKRLQAKGFGPSKPVTGNDTAQGRALNRRVELSLLP